MGNGLGMAEKRLLEMLSLERGPEPIEKMLPRGAGVGELAPSSRRYQACRHTLTPRSCQPPAPVATVRDS